MSETSIDFTVDIPGVEERRQRPKNVNLQQVVAWLKVQEYDEYIIQELIKKVSKYPSGTYYRFREDLQKHIADIQKKRKRD